MEEQPNPPMVEPEVDQVDPVEESQNTKLTEPYSWQAREGVEVTRNSTWYIWFAAVAVGLILLDILVFKSYTFTALVVVMAIAVVILAQKPPRIINYSVSPKGVYVEDRLYDFSEFRAFGIIQEPGNPSIILLPVSRFSPGLTLYFTEEQGEAIVDMLGARLPIQEVKIDALERFIRMIRL